MARKTLLMLVFVLVTLVATSPPGIHATRGLPASISADGLKKATAEAAYSVSQTGNCRRCPGRCFCHYVGRFLECRCL